MEKLFKKISSYLFFFYSHSVVHFTLVITHSDSCWRLFHNRHLTEKVAKLYCYLFVLLILCCYTFCVVNAFLQRVIEGKIMGGGIEVTGRWGRIRRKLLDDLKERRGYSHLKEEALDRTVWRARFGPAVRQTTEWIHYHHIKRYHMHWLVSSLDTFSFFALRGQWPVT